MRVYHRIPGLPQKTGFTTENRVYHRISSLPQKTGFTTENRVYHRKPGLPQNTGLIPQRVLKNTAGCKHDVSAEETGEVVCGEGDDA